MTSFLAADWNRLWRKLLSLILSARSLLLRVWRKLDIAWETGRFATLISEFLVEVAVLLFVFPGLEIILRRESDRLAAVIGWSWGISIICLVVAAIIPVGVQT